MISCVHPGTNLPHSSLITDPLKEGALGAAAGALACGVPGAIFGGVLLTTREFSYNLITSKNIFGTRFSTQPLWIIAAKIATFVAPTFLALKTLSYFQLALSFKLILVLWQKFVLDQAKNYLLLDEDDLHFYKTIEPNQTSNSKIYFIASFAICLFAFRFQLKKSLLSFASSTISSLLIDKFISFLDLSKRIDNPRTSQIVESAIKISLTTAAFFFLAHYIFGSALLLTTALKFSLLKEIYFLAVQHIHIQISQDKATLDLLHN